MRIPSPRFDSVRVALKNSVHVRKLETLHKGVYPWIATFKQDGKIRKKYFASQEAANAFRDERQDEALTHGIRHRLTDEERSAVIETRQLLSSLGLSLREAIAIAAELQAQRSRSATVSTLMHEHILLRQDEGRGERHVRDMKGKLGLFCQTFGNHLVADITGQQITDWLRSLKLPSNNSILSYRRILNGMFVEGVKRGYALNNPVKVAIKPKEEEIETEVLTPEQAGRLLAAADPEILPAFAIGMFAGLRNSEIQKLEWHHIDLRRNFIRVPSATKTGKRLVPIEPNLREWLSPSAGRTGKLVPVNARQREESARKAAGLSRWPRNVLRHSYASYHLANYGEIGRLAEYMGDSPDVIRKHYREVVYPEDAAEFWRLSPTCLPTNGS